MNETAATTPRISLTEAIGLTAAGAALIDVRTDQEWEISRIPGATHVPLTELAAHAAELDPSKELVIYCRTDNRSQMAAEALAGAGYNAHFMEGGIKAWAEAGKEIEPAGAPIG